MSKVTNKEAIERMRYHVESKGNYSPTRVETWDYAGPWHARVLHLAEVLEKTKFWLQREIDTFPAGTWKQALEDVQLQMKQLESPPAPDPKAELRNALDDLWEKIESQKFHTRIGDFTHCADVVRCDNIERLIKEVKQERGVNNA